MIQVPGDIWAAMHAPTIKKKTRCTWTLNNGDDIDITDRVIDYGEVVRTIAPRLAGFTVSQMVLELHNTDRFLSVAGAGSESLLGPMHPSNYLFSEILVEQAVWGEQTGWHYLPVYRGVLKDISYPDRGTATMILQERTSFLFGLIVPEDVEVDPSVTAGQAIRTLLTTHTKIVSGDIDTAGTFDFAESVQDDLDWTLFGVIPGMTSVGRAVNDLARSGFGTVYSDEDGTIKYHTEFPNTAGQEIRLGYSFPAVIDETNAGRFTYGMMADNLVTEIIVDYQNVNVSYRDTTYESSIGRVAARVAMPYLGFMRCARQAARVLYDAYGGNGSDTATFSTAALGLTMQLTDEVKVDDPSQGVEDTFRVIGKAWNEQEVSFICLKEGHRSSYLTKAFAEFDTTAVTSATEYYW